VLTRQFEHRGAAGGLDDVVAIGFQNVVQELHIELVILDDQDPFWRGARRLIGWHQ
jgi:hypothetical protein